MRVTNLIALGASALLACACVATSPTGDSPSAPTSKALSNDCAVVAALAKEHYKFGPDNAAPSLNPAATKAGRRAAISAPTASPSGIMCNPCPAPIRARA